MITINKNIQSEMIMTTMEEIVPEDSMFRKIDKYIDFTFIYDKAKELYCENNGRPSIDPVVLFKIVFIQAIDGIKSMRQTCKKIKVDAEYRWFLGIPFGTDTPHFSTFSKNYERRFKGSNIFEEIFVEIVNQAIKYNLIDGTTFYTDSTHKKANANKNKYEDEIVKNIKERRKWLEEEINEERIKQGRKPFEYKDEIEEKHIKVSKTDKESGYYHRDNKEKGFMYLDHRTVDDKCNIIVDAYVTKGNVHDSGPFIDRAEYIKRTFGFDIKKYGVDSGYLTLDIKKYFIENNIFAVFGYRRYGTRESRKEKSNYQYIKEIDVYVDKNDGEVLEYKGLIDKLGYKKYQNQDKTKIVRRHIHEEWNEQFRENRLSKEGKELYQRRKEHVERSFADSKQNHGYRYAMYKGVKKNQHYTWLICAAQNMKNIAIKNDNVGKSPLTLSSIFNKFIKISKIIINFNKKFIHKKTSRKNLGVCLHSEKYIEYFIGLSLIFSFILPQIVYVGSIYSNLFANINKILNNINLQYIGGFTTYFILGWYLNNYNIKNKKLLYIFGIIGFILTFTATAILSITTGKAIQLYDNLTINVFFQSLMVFIIVKNKYQSLNKMNNKLLLGISKNSLGIYAIHPFLISKIYPILAKINFNNALINILVVYVIILIISYIIVYIMKKIPLLKNVV